MNICIDERELTAALKAIKTARKNGFNFCLAVLDFQGQVPNRSWIKVLYSDLWERAHPTDGKYDWGRCQSVSERNKFINGKLVAIKGKTK